MTHTSHVHDQIDSREDHVGMKNNNIAYLDFSMQKSFQQLGQIWWVLGLSDHTSHMWSTVQRGRPSVARYDRVSVIGRPADIYMLTSAQLMAGLGLACWPKKDPSLISRSYLFTRHVKPNNDRGKEIPDLSTIIQHRIGGMTFFLVNPRTIEHLLLCDFFSFEDRQKCEFDNT